MFQLENIFRGLVRLREKRNTPAEKHFLSVVSYEYSVSEQNQFGFFCCVSDSFEHVFCLSHLSEWHRVPGTGPTLAVISGAIAGNLAALLGPVVSWGSHGLAALGLPDTLCK